MISSENPVQPTSSFVTNFISDGSPVSLTLGSTGVTGVGDAIFVLTDSLEITSIPEPSSAAFFGLAGLALIMRRRR